MGSLIAPSLAYMKRLLLIAGAGALLAGCMSPYGWADDGYYGGGDPYFDTGYHGGYGGGYYGAPVGWWGSNAASIDVFYGLLGGYGSWQPYGNYGRVFIPSNMAAGWQPYSRGNWQRDSRYGQMWVSGDPFGWATDHYGRWGHDNRLGWFWVPDTKFGPGWVDWRTNNGRRSWAPALPRNWSGGAPTARRWISAPTGQRSTPARRTTAGQPFGERTARTPDSRDWKSRTRGPVGEGFAEGFRPGAASDATANRRPARVTTPGAAVPSSGTGTSRAEGRALRRWQAPGGTGSRSGASVRSTDPAASSAAANRAGRAGWRSRRTTATPVPAESAANASRSSAPRSAPPGVRTQTPAPYTRAPRPAGQSSAGQSARQSSGWSSGRAAAGTSSPARQWSGSAQRGQPMARGRR